MTIDLTTYKLALAHAADVLGVALGAAAEPVPVAVVAPPVPPVALPVVVPPVVPPAPPMTPVVVAPVPVVVATPDPPPAQPIKPKTPVSLMVGPNQQWKFICEAMEPICARLFNGEALAVTMQLEASPDPLYYANDFSSHYHHPSGWPTFEQTFGCDMILERAPGTNGLIPIPMTAAGALYYGKGIFIAQGGNLTLRGLAISGAKRGDVDGNFSGVRYDSGFTTGNMLIEDCELFEDDDGLLGGNAGQTLTLNRVYFHGCGSGSGYTHNVYASRFDLVTATDVLSVGAKVGHLFKCRAAKTVLRRVRLFDGPDGTASYCFDAPNGGIVDIDGLITHKSAKASNAPTLAIGEEGDNGGGFHANTSIRIRNWTAFTERADALLLWNGQNSPTDIQGTQAFGYAGHGMQMGMFGSTDLPLAGHAFPDDALTVPSVAPTLDYSSPVDASPAAP